MLPSGCGGSSSVGDATNGSGGNGGGGVVTGTPLLDQYKKRDGFHQWPVQDGQDRGHC